VNGDTGIVSLEQRKIDKWFRLLVEVVSIAIVGDDEFERFAVRAKALAQRVRPRPVASQLLIDDGHERNLPMY
jgi:hypothetical protein